MVLPVLPELCYPSLAIEVLPDNVLALHVVGNHGILLHWFGFLFRLTLGEDLLETDHTLFFLLIYTMMYL